MSELTQAELKEVLRYEPESGKWFWIKTSKYRKSNLGKEAGCVSKSGNLKGRRSINVRGKLYLASRLAWLYMTGKWPKHMIDHMDGNPSNDKWENLRDIRRGENVRNSMKRGYTWCNDRSKWRVRYRLNGKLNHIGYFNCQLDARAAYLSAIKSAGLSIPRLEIN